MKTTFARLLLLGLCALPIVRLTAQPASATFRAALLESYPLGFARTAEGDLSRGGMLGRVAVAHFDFGVTGRTSLSPSTILLHGFAYARNTLDTSGAVILPDALEELTLSLGVQLRRSEQWSFAAYLRPGFYGDSLDLDSNSLNAPLLGMAIYSVSRDLSWIFGFSANAAADTPFLPIAGVRWQYAPDWTLNIGFPRAGVTWRRSDRLAFNAGATVQGGDYFVSESLGVPAPGISRLARTWLEYREIRLGAGAEFALSAGVTLSVDAGLALDQRFDYFDRGYELKGDTPLFVALALKGRF